LEIVDGQQRIATCYLTMICARDYFYQRDEENKMKNPGAPPVDNNLEEMEGYLYHPDPGTSKPDVNNPIVELGQLNKSKQFFDNSVIVRLIPTAKSLQMKKTWPNDSCKNMYRAYELISEQLGKIISSQAGSSNPKQAYSDIRELIDTLLEAFFVFQISVPDRPTAYEMFGALNHRGTGKLKDPDLIKWQLFGELDKELSVKYANDPVKQENDIEKYDGIWTDIWNDITGREDADYDLNSFLYNYVVNFLNTSATSNTILRQFESHNKTSKGQAIGDLIDDIRKQATAFVYLRNPKKHFANNLNLNFYLGTLKKMGSIKHAYVPIVAGYEKLWQNGTTKSRKKFELLVQVITRYHVRNITLGNAEVKKIEIKMKEVMENIKKDKSVNEIIDDLVNDKEIHFPDSTIKDKIDEQDWTSSVPVLIYVLEELEGQSGKNSGVDISHEHIMPRTANPATTGGKRWIDHIKQTRGCQHAGRPANCKDCDDEATTFHKEWRNKLGNLTLLSKKPNAEAQQKLLVDKIPLYNKDVFDITKEIDTIWTQTSKEWTEKEISNRHNTLKNQLLDKLNIEQLKTRP